MLLMFGWGVQLVTGFLLNRWLAKTLSLELYGTYGIVMGILMWFEIGAISGIPTALQKFTAADERQASRFLVLSSRIQAVFTLFFFGTAFLGAPLIGDFLKDTALAGYLKIAVWDIWTYSAFFILMHLQNGLLRFSRQALMIIVFSVAKMVAVVVFVSLMRSLDGAFYGNIAGSFIAMGLGFIYLARSNLQPARTTVDWRPLLRFAIPVTIFSLAINLFLNIDLWAVKYFIGGASTGYYSAASLIARVPYFIFFGLSATVLPGLSRALARNDKVQALNTLRTAFRLLYSAVLPICLLSLRYSRDIIIFIFRAEYAPGGDLFRTLIWAFSLLSFFFLLTTALNAADSPRISMGITAAGVILDVMLNGVLIQRFGIAGAPLATLLSLLIVTAVAGYVVVRRFGPVVPFVSFLKISGAAGLIYLISLLIDVTGLGAIAAMAGLCCLYGIVLIVVKELRPEDIVD